MWGVRILKAKFKFEKVKVCVDVAYGSSEGDAEESEAFKDNWNSASDWVSGIFR